MTASVWDATIWRRAANQIRPVSFQLGIAPNATGSVLVAMGNTRVIRGVMIA
jgi:ribonuclease PH